MLSYLSLAAVCLGVALAANNVEQDVKSAVNEVTTTKDGDTYCPVPLVGTKCGSSTIFHYWKCCGDLNKECCFNLQTWVWVTLALFGVIFIASFVISLVRCICCRK